jgi:hypothetical protein
MWLAYASLDSVGDNQPLIERGCMSDIPSGGESIFIAGGASGNWYVHFSENDWPGDVVVQAQPLNTGAAMTCVPGSIHKLSDGSYKFWTRISNSGNSTFFNLQVSTT